MVHSFTYSTLYLEQLCTLHKSLYTFTGVLGASVASVEVWRRNGFPPMRAEQYNPHEPRRPSTGLEKCQDRHQTDNLT